MTAPTYAWATIADAEIDPDSSLTGDDLVALSHNLVHLREWIGYSYFAGAERDHDHDGVNSAIIAGGVGPNIIQNAMPESGSEEGWTLSGVGDDDSLGHDWDGNGSAETAYQIMGSRAANKGMFGTTGTTSTAGNDWVLSFFVRSAGATSGGTLRFGFADGSTSSYITGCRGDVTGTLITTSWQRFYMKLLAKGSNPTTDLRLLMSVNGTIGSQFWTSGYMVHFGTFLMPFAFGPLEPSGNDDYTGLSEDCPVWDRAISMTNAVAITGV